MSRSDERALEIMSWRRHSEERGWATAADETNATGIRAGGALATVVIGGRRGAGAAMHQMDIGEYWTRRWRTHPGRADAGERTAAARTRIPAARMR